jgi:hypothetical protein
LVDVEDHADYYSLFLVDSELVTGLAAGLDGFFLVSEWCFPVWVKSAFD